MKFTLLFVLSCLSVCFANPPTVTDYGNVNAENMGVESVVVESTPLRVKEYILDYPKDAVISKILILLNILCSKFFFSMIFFVLL